MAAIPYDEMTEDSAETAADPEESTESDPADDDEFMMHAEKAGFSGEKAKALWLAVARCVELTGSGSAVSLGGEEES